MSLITAMTLTVFVLSLALVATAAVAVRRSRATMKRAIRRAFPAASVGYRDQRVTATGTAYAQLSAASLRYSRC
ncbi:MAG: hypothetical protein KC636_34200 [Myxococcales bacterium]|nr:hypothetical protein [Myxococcales bacterium]